MKNPLLRILLAALLLCVFALNASAQKVSALTETTIPASQSLLSLAHTNGGGGYVTRSTKLSNLFNKRGDVWTAGHQFKIQTTNSNPGILMFDTESHDGGARGIVLLGATQGDVVINPSTAGVFQIGQSGNAGAQHYMQYASYPDAGNPMGFSHPFQFRVLSYNGGSVAWKYPGLVSYASANDASEQGRMVIYSRLPYWAFGNHNPNSPTTAGTEIASFDTNGVVAALGIKFIGNGGSLTNDAGQTLGTGGGGSGLTTNIVVMSAGQPLVQYFTNGSLSAITTDTDASNYIAAVIATGASLTDNQKLAVTKFTVSRKWFNTWSDADVIAPIIGGSATAHAVMLKGTNAMTYVNTPTHDANGITFNGTSSYANTGFKCSISVNYSQNSGRILLVVPKGSASFTTFSYLAGDVTTTGGTIYQGFFRNTATSIAINGVNNANGNGGEPGATTIQGVMIASRTGANAHAGYFWPAATAVGAPGSSVTPNAASSGLPAQNIYIGARNYEGFSPDYYSAFTSSGFEAGAGCDATQAQYIRDAWAQLQLDLAR